MGKNTKITCTILPNGVKGGRLHFSLFLTPKLPVSGKLKEYYEILKWYDFTDFFVKNTNLKAVFGVLEAQNGAIGKYSISNETQPFEINYEKSKLESIRAQCDCKELWSKLFKESTPVSGWVVNQTEITPLIPSIYDIDELKKNYQDNPQASKLIKQFERGQIQLSEFNAMLASNLGVRANALRQPVVNERAYQDIGSLKMSLEEVRIRNKENQEFHKKISALADYPHLLRVTGWIIDYSIALENEIKTKNLIKLTGFDDIKGNFKDSLKWSNFLNEIQFETPWTYVENDGKVFRLAYENELSKQYFVISDGHVNSKGSNYELRADQFDREMMRRKIDLADIDSDAQQELKENFLKEGDKIIDLTSNGIALKIEINVNRQASSDEIIRELANKHPVNVAVRNNPETYNQEIIVGGTKNSSPPVNEYVIFGHNLDVGYRVDVEELGNGTNFKSLCLRESNYAIDRSPYSSSKNKEVVVKNYKDEPWVSESAQVGKSGRLYTNEELFRWDNWSLTCPHLGEYPQDETALEEDLEFNDLELVNIRPQDKSLTPLRFGKKYRFKLRVVDLAGNSVNTKDHSLAKHWIDMTEEYKRLEPVEPPELFYTKKIFKIKRIKDKNEVKQPDGSYKTEKTVTFRREILERYQGEKLDTLVVKTRIVNDNTSYDGDCTRSLAAPKCTVNFTEVHGVLDSVTNLKNAYNKAAYQPDRYIEIFQSGYEIPFITDPAAKAITIGLDASANGMIKAVARTINWNPASYLKRKFHELRLLGGSKVELMGEGTNTITVKLRPGIIAKGSISSVVDKNPKGYSTDGSDSIFNSQFVEDVRNKVGKLKMTDTKPLLYVHAVQKPMIVSENLGFISSYTITSEIQDRNKDEDLKIRFKSFEFNKLNNNKRLFPVATSGEFILQASYNECIVDLDEDAGYRLQSKTYSKRFSNLENSTNSLKSLMGIVGSNVVGVEGVKITNIEDNSPVFDAGLLVGDVITAINGVQSGSLEELTNLIQSYQAGEGVNLDYKRVNTNYKVKVFLRGGDEYKLKFEDEAEASEFLKAFDGFEHSFGDTRFFKVDYQLGAISRFKEFFPDETEFSITGQLGHKIVKSSKKPAAPVIESVIPIFSWDKDQNGERVTRSQYTFRVNLGNEWYSSGEGEELAVIYLDLDEKKGEENTIPDSYEGLVSEVGMDPTTKSDPINSANFGDIYDKLFADTKVEPKIDYRLLDRAPSKFTVPLIEPKPDQAKTLGATVFPVKFDKSDKKFYSDIRVDAKVLRDQYFPFLKFAVARYQKNAIVEANKYDYRFSTVVMTPQVQLIPERIIDIKKCIPVLDQSLKTQIGNKKLEWYLLLESDKEGEFQQLVEDKEVNESTRRIELMEEDINNKFVRFKELSEIQDEIDLLKEKVNFRPKKIFIEEFECYEVDKFTDNGKAFSMDDEMDTYNPRNDIRKRLVFTYQLK